MYLFIIKTRIFKLTLNVFQSVRELHHVLFFVLLKYLELNVKGLIPDDQQLLHKDQGAKRRCIKNYAKLNSEESSRSFIKLK